MTPLGENLEMFLCYSAGVVGLCCKLDLFFRLDMQWFDVCNKVGMYKRVLAKELLVLGVSDELSRVSASLI